MRRLLLALISVLAVAMAAPLASAQTASSGWTPPKALAAGTEIVVQGYQAKSGENKLNGGYVTFKDGTRLFAGGSNPSELPQK